jgi:hypothetical protein
VRSCSCGEAVSRFEGARKKVSVLVVSLFLR